MTLSRIAALLGLDETDGSGVRVVPLTDADIASAGQGNRAQRRAQEHARPRKKRDLHGAKR